MNDPSGVKSGGIFKTTDGEIPGHYKRLLQDPVDIQ